MMVELREVPHSSEDYRVGDRGTVRAFVQMPGGAQGLAVNLPTSKLHGSQLFKRENLTQLKAVRERGLRRLF